jgi:hypothetical protein
VRSKIGAVLVNEVYVKLFETSSSFRFLAAFFTDKTSMDLVHYIRALGKFLYFGIAIAVTAHRIELEN